MYHCRLIYFFVKMFFKKLWLKHYLHFLAAAECPSPVTSRQYAVCKTQKTKNGFINGRKISLVLKDSHKNM